MIKKKLNNFKDKINYFNGSEVTFMEIWLLANASQEIGRLCELLFT